jgi:sigma-B regulation protein RsbU (phosphoserine phosphatase)
LKPEKSTIKKSSLADLYNLMPGYFLSFSHEGLVTHINNTFLGDLDYTASDVIGLKNFNDLLTVGSRIFFQTHFYPLIKLHGKFNEIFLSFLTKNGEELPVLLNVKLEGDGEEFEIHCAGLQITQRNRYEKEILEAKNVAEKALLENEALNHYKQQLESNLEDLEKRLKALALKNHEHQQINMIISHDLQEPLRKVSIFSDKIISLKGSILDLEVLNDLKKIDSASRKMRDLVINLQQFLSLNETRLAPERVNLKTVIQQAQQQLGMDSNNPSLRLTIGDMPGLNADKQLLANLFYQLLHNSLKFRDHNKPKLDINIVADIVEQNIFKHLDYKYNYKEFIRITYTDNGVGFSNSFATEIFSLFRKAHDTEEGLGIGLAYCKKIMELHEGIISASSKQGQSTTFTLHFPNFS